jgi:transcription termination factor NusA
MNTAITGVSGIGPGTVRVLMENGFKTLEDIAGSSIAQLAAVPGFGPARAGKVIKAANDRLSANAGDTSKAAPAEAPASTRTRRTAQKPVRQPAKPADTEAKPEETVLKEVKEKVQEKLKKAEKAVEKQAKKAGKAAERLAKKAKKAVEEKAKEVEKAAERLAKKAKKATANLVKKAKKAKKGKKK